MTKSGAAVPHGNISSKYIFGFTGPAVIYVRPEQNTAYTGTQHRTYSHIHGYTAQNVQPHTRVHSTERTAAYTGTQHRTYSHIHGYTAQNVQLSGSCKLYLVSVSICRMFRTI